MNALDILELEINSYIAYDFEDYRIVITLLGISPVNICMLGDWRSFLELNIKNMTTIMKKDNLNNIDMNTNLPIMSKTYHVSLDISKLIIEDCVVINSSTKKRKK